MSASTCGITKLPTGAVFGEHWIFSSHSATVLKNGSTSKLASFPPVQSMPCCEERLRNISTETMVKSYQSCDRSIRRAVRIYSFGSPNPVDWLFVKNHPLMDSP